MTTRFLIDTSALIRIQRNQVADLWQDRVQAGVIVLCDPVIAETLATANAANYTRAEAQLHLAYPWVAVPTLVWNSVTELRRGLAVHSAHQGLSVADLLVAATALLLNLTVLHQDADFETVARFFPALQQERIIPAG
jgi:predicted nucleic acid-binding protein